MQEIQVIGGPHGYLSSCPHLDSTCPTCGQFFLLQTTVQELTRHLQELSKRVYGLSYNFIRYSLNNKIHNMPVRLQNTLIFWFYIIHQFKYICG